MSGAYEVYRQMTIHSSQCFESAYMHSRAVVTYHLKNKSTELPFARIPMSDKPAESTITVVHLAMTGETGVVLRHNTNLIT